MENISKPMFIIHAGHTIVTYCEFDDNADNHNIKPKIVRTFKGFSLDYSDVNVDANGEGHHLITDIFEFLSLIEILKSYNYKKLNKDKQYNSKSFIAKVSQKKDKDNPTIYTLMIKFIKNDRTIYIDRIHCAILVAQFTKAISQCDIWGNQCDVNIEYNLEIKNAKR